MFPNCTARPGGGKQLVGPQLTEAANVSGLTVRRPIERGYLTNADLQVRTRCWCTAVRRKTDDSFLLGTVNVISMTRDMAPNACLE